MVDFQSRNTRSRSDDDGEDEEPDPDESETTESEPEEEPPAPATDSEPSEDSATVGVAVVTIADDQTVDEDRVGDAVVDALAGHELVTRELLGRSHDTVQQAVDTLVNRGDVDAVVTAGGAGIDREDITIEAVHPLFEKVLPGFGELFRRRYSETVGTDVISIRTTAGIADGTPVFCLPGSADAARLGVSEIVTEQVARLAGDDDGTPT